MLKSSASILFAAIAFCTATATLALAASPASVSETSKGKALVDAKGMTLYTFAKDSEGKSACNGPCAVNWPPLKAETSATAMAPYSVVTRDDGSKQWAYSGKALYTYAKDAKAGETTGDGFNGVWHLAQP